MFASARLKVDDVGGRDGLLTLAAPPTPHTRRWTFAAGPRWHSRRPPVRASLSLERGPAAAVRPTGRERIEPQASKNAREWRILMPRGAFAAVLACTVLCSVEPAFAECRASLPPASERAGHWQY